MAINPNTNASMTGRVTAADANYTYGSSKDETAPGANDGTPYFLGRANDIFGFQQWLLTQAGIVPSGNADTILASDYGDALDFLFSRRTSTEVADFDDATGGGSYHALSGAANAPSAAAVNWSIVTSRRNDNNLVQLATSEATNLTYTRTRTGGAWSPTWTFLWGDATYQPEVLDGLGVPVSMINNSGGNILAGASVPAASLLHAGGDAAGNTVAGPAPTVGTWENKFGATVAAGGTAPFVRTT